MNNNKQTIWITRTALFLAVAVIAQIIGTNIGGGLFGQLLSGTLVNMALIVAGIVVGISSGLTIGLVSPIIAFFLGIMKFAPAIPVVIAGNLIIVLLTVLLFRNFTGFSEKAYIEKIVQVMGIIIAACCKCAAMWISALYILPLFVEKVPPAIVTSFSFPQIITGTLGGIIALVVIPTLLKVKRKDS